MLFILIYICIYIYILKRGALLHPGALLWGSRGRSPPAQFDMQKPWGVGPLAPARDDDAIGELLIIRKGTTALYKIQTS